ncbi:MAG: nucleoside triphosphate pyrophosphohydrolase [Christensenellales bacterium]|jgi:tetrapyrrole methylase family protein/MazG family protein
MQPIITVVGLGPGDPALLTRRAEETLQQASALILRTARHPAYRWLMEQGIACETLDALYDEAEDFETLARRAAQVVAQRAQGGGLVYAVPGDGVTGDGTVDALRATGVALRVEPGVSDASAALARCASEAGDASAGLFTVPAALLGEAAFSERAPLLVTQLDDAAQAGQVKLLLAGRYGDEAPAVYIGEAGAQVIPLYELDRRADIDHRSCVYLPPRRPEHCRYSWDDLVDIMDMLRQPGGCPWDREQTHISLRRYLLEECFETLDAIERGDMEALCGELGDILMQVVFHSRVAAERGDFDARDVTDGICRKMLRRHPHVFGQGTAATPGAVSEVWDAIKRKEKGQRSFTETLEEVPGAFTALMQAEKIQSRAARAGFDWPDASGPLEKIGEEIAELRGALAARPRDPAHVEEELGDLLFAVVNAARHIGVSPELALRRACRKFTERFAYIEDRATASGRKITSLTLDEMENYWKEYKERDISETNQT